MAWLARAAQRVDLLGGLAHPQFCENLRRQPLLRSGQGGPEPQHLLRPHPVGQADRGHRPQPAGDDGVRVLRLAPSHDLHAEGGDARRLDGWDLQLRRDDERLTIGRQHEARQPLEREHLVPGQPAQVRAGRHEQGTESGIGAGLPCV